MAVLGSAYVAAGQDITIGQLNAVVADITTLATLKRAVRRQGAQFTAVGTSTVVTTLMSGKTAGGSETTLGVVTGPVDTVNNKVDLVYATGENKGDHVVESSTGARVYGRLSFASNVWTVNFYKLDASGNEVAYTMPSTAVLWYYWEVFNFHETPTFPDVFAISSDNASAQVPDATSTVKGKVSVGSNLSVSSGVISLASAGVTGALGFTPLNKAGDTMTGQLNVSVATDTPLKIHRNETGLGGTGIAFDTNNAAGTRKTYGWHYVIPTDNTAGSEDADHYFYSLKAGASAEVMRVLSTGEFRLNGVTRVDASGNATFNDISIGSVLKTGNMTKIVPFLIRGYGNNTSAQRAVYVGATNVSTSGRGLNLVIINKSDLSVVSTTGYDTYGLTSASDSLADALNALTKDQIGILASADAWEGAVTARLRQAAKRLGLHKLYVNGTSGSRQPYAAIFEGLTVPTDPGTSTNVYIDKAVEVLNPDLATSPQAEIRGWFIDGSFVAVGDKASALSGAGIGAYVSGSTFTSLGGIRALALADPSAPTVTVQGTAGTTSYTYYVIAKTAGGQKTFASTGTTITTGNATLSATNFNRITWNHVLGAHSYDICRGSTSSVIATVGGHVHTLDDTGRTAVTVTAPSRNNTADVQFDGNFTAMGSDHFFGSSTTKYNNTGSSGFSANDPMIQLMGGSSNAAVVNLVRNVDADAAGLGMLWFSRTGGQSDAHRNVAGIVGRQSSTGVNAGGYLEFMVKGGASPFVGARLKANGNTAADLDLFGTLYLSGTQVFDSSRNLINIGSLTMSGGITSSAGVLSLGNGRFYMDPGTTSPVRWNLRVGDGSGWKSRFVQSNDTTVVMEIIDNVGLNIGSGFKLQHNGTDVINTSRKGFFVGAEVSGTLDMVNNNITRVNNISFDDPGPDEGLFWNNGSGWKIFESPDDLTTNTGGNLQFVVNGNRHVTLETDGTLTGVYGRSRFIKSGYATVRRRFGGDVDKVWKKILSMSNPQSGSYRAINFRGVMTNHNGNHGQSIPYLFPFAGRVTFRGANVQVDTAALSVSQSMPDILRLVKVATNSYELQVRQHVDYTIINYELEVIMAACDTWSYHDLETATFIATDPTPGTGTLVASTVDNLVFAGKLSADSLSLNTDIAFTDTSGYWLKTATNWGIYWNTTDNQIEFHGGGTMRAEIDLDDGSAQFGALVTLNGYSGTSGNLNGGALKFRSGVQLTTVAADTTAGTYELVARGMKQLRFENGSNWDYNKWAGIGYDSTNAKLYIGGPASSWFQASANPPRIDVLIDGTKSMSVDSKFTSKNDYNLVFKTFDYDVEGMIARGTPNTDASTPTWKSEHGGCVELKYDAAKGFTASSWQLMPTTAWTAVEYPYIEFDYKYVDTNMKINLMYYNTTRGAWRAIGFAPNSYSTATTLGTYKNMGHVTMIPNGGWHHCVIPLAEFIRYFSAMGDTDQVGDTLGEVIVGDWTNTYAANQSILIDNFRITATPAVGLSPEFGRYMRLGELSGSMSMPQVIEFEASTRILGDASVAWTLDVGKDVNTSATNDPYGQLDVHSIVGHSPFKIRGYADDYTEVAGITASLINSVSPAYYGSELQFSGRWTTAGSPLTYGYITYRPDEQQFRHLTGKGFHFSATGLVQGDDLFMINNPTSGNSHSSTLIVMNEWGNHSWGVTAEFRTVCGISGGVDHGGDRPSILFVGTGASHRWSVGYGGSDDHFRIRQNHGYLDQSWGTERFRIDPTNGYIHGGSFYATNWFRTSGATGWYNESYGGGMFQNDSTWVRAYNSKNLVGYHLATDGGIIYGPWNEIHLQNSSPYDGGRGAVYFVERISSNKDYSDVFGKGFFGVGADLAEVVPSPNETAAGPGDLMIIDETEDEAVIKHTGVQYDRMIAGVWSTNPGIVLGAMTENGSSGTLPEDGPSATTDPGEFDPSSTIRQGAPLAIGGRVPAKVTTKYITQDGEVVYRRIRRGDMLVASSVPGHLMAADPSDVGGQLPLGSVVGKAMQPFDPGELTEGEVIVWVNIA